MNWNLRRTGNASLRWACFTTAGAAAEGNCQCGLTVCFRGNNLFTFTSAIKNLEKVDKDSFEA